MTETSDLPNSPLGEQLRWLFARLFTALADEAEITEHFSPTFLADVPASQMVALSARLARDFEGLTITNVTITGQTAAAVTITAPSGATALVPITIEPDPPHRFSGLRLSAVEDISDVGESRSAGVRVIVLNGVSSAGKSTVAKALQIQLKPQAWLHVEIDAFLRMLPPPLVAVDGIKRAIDGAHGAMAALVAAGNRVIIDHVLEQPQWWPDLAGRLKDAKILLVGVHCDPKVLDERERARSDRMIGQARSQLASTHGGKTYDIEVDTSTTPAAECAATIVAAVAARPADRKHMPLR